MPVPALHFDPAVYSLEELRFLMVHLGKPVTVALMEIDERRTPGVNATAVRKFMTIVNDLEDLRQHRGHSWAGMDAVKDSITRYLLWAERAEEIHRKGGPRHPSHYTWDSTGRIARGGIGADSSDMVRSEITDEGERKPFRVNLREEGIAPDARDAMPWLAATKDAKKHADSVIHNEQAGTLTCTVCDKAISYSKKQGSAALNRARGHMARHLKTAKDELTRHRVLYAKEFPK